MVSADQLQLEQMVVPAVQNEQIAPAEAHGFFSERAMIQNVEGCVHEHIS